MFMKTKNQKAFTIVELMVVVGIIALLAGIIIASVNFARAKARDSKRLADMRTIQEALVLYNLDYGTYPVHSAEAGLGGWDTPTDGVFIGALVSGGYIPGLLSDPAAPLTTNYRYHRYATTTQGCPGPFAILAIVDLETHGRPASMSPGAPCYAQLAGFDWVQMFSEV